MGMPFALELRAVSKRFVVGTAGCTGSVSVLRCADLVVRPAEAVVVVGAAGAGKSTLLLCAAGLLRVDSGTVAWFGDSNRGVAAERATYHFAGASSSRRAPRGTKPHVHLVDGPEALCFAAVSRISRWIERRRADGDAVLLAARDAALARDLVSRVVILHNGRVSADGVSTPARVAEYAIERRHP